MNVENSRAIGRHWFVYEHFKLDTNEVFYVGVGIHRKKGNKYKRATERQKRNNHWKSTMLKHGFNYRILFDCLTKDEACEKEISVIKKYGMENLCNKTCGGDGIRSVSVEDRKKISDRMKKMWEDPIKRQLMTEKIRNTLKNPEVRAARINQIRSVAPDSTKISEDLKKRWKNSDWVNEFSTKIKAKWADDDYRNNMVSKIKANTSRPEHREKVSIRTKNLWRTKEFRDKTTEAIRENSKKETYKKSISNSSKRMWANPEIRKKILTSKGLL